MLRAYRPDEVKILAEGPSRPKFLFCILNQHFSVDSNFTHGVGFIYCGLDCVLLRVIGTVLLVVEAKLPFIVVVYD